MNEVVSAMSSLNMPADLIPGAQGYLSQTDANAKHAMEHLNAVFQLLQRAILDRSLAGIKRYGLKFSSQNFEAVSSLTSLLCSRS